MQTEGFVKTLVVAGVVVSQDGKFLLVQERQPKAFKLWNLPAGKLDPGESFEQAAIREAKEETGFDVEIIREIDIYQESPTNAVAHVFEAKIMGGELAFPEDELLNAGWFSLKEISKMKLRRPWVLEAILEVAK